MIKPTDRKDLEIAGAALRGFTQIARAWRLNDEEQSAVLGTSPAIASAQLDAGQLDAYWPGTVERISYLLGIYAALHTIFPNRQQADDWIRRPNKSPVFNGETALALMRTGRLIDLATVRGHLDGLGLDKP